MLEQFYVSSSSCVYHFDVIKHYKGRRLRDNASFDLRSPIYIRFGIIDDLRAVEK